ncbi:hypothetical protein C1645_432278 [Glomus cerebriforme]|uniref:Uncharacterized protein n=1 Tax=Glomus cerebriforme TaxID=658196 RepID=A0A397SDJ5_9GLOM|nr:hypothetical protein C1645_432278 [Glomus cerebriforme]
MKFKTDRDNFKTKFEQLEKENTVFKQENAQSKQEITKLRDSYEVQKKKFQGHVQNMQRTLQQKAASQLQACQEQLKKEIEELKKQNEELKKQFEEKSKQVGEALEKEQELLRIKAQESMYKSKINKLEAENTDLKQKVQSSTENSSKAEVAEVTSQPTAETITKDTAVKTEEFLQSILPMTSTSLSMPTTPNLPNVVTPAVQFDSSTSPRSPFQVVQESPSDIQENVSQPPNVQQTSVQLAGDGPNTTGTSVSTRQSGNNTGQIQNAPREKPPVKIQRHRPFPPSSPRIGPFQVASPTPTIEEQPLNQPQTMPDIEKVVQPSETSETVTTVQPVQQVQTKSASPLETESQTSTIEETSTEATAERKRSWDEVETLQEPHPIQAEDFDVITPSNVDEEETKKDNGDTTLQITIEDVSELPATKKVKLEEE